MGIHIMIYKLLFNFFAFVCLLHIMTQCRPLNEYKILWTKIKATNMLYFQKKIRVITIRKLMMEKINFVSLSRHLNHPNHPPKK